MKSEGWSKGLVHSVQCIPQQISGNHHKNSDNKDTNTVELLPTRGVVTKQSKYHHEGRNSRQERTGDEKKRRKNNKRRSKTLNKSNWSPKRKQAYPTVQQDRKCLLWGQGSPLDPIKRMHEINSDIMLLGQQMQVDWWRQMVRVIASCWLSLGDAIFSQSLLPACENDMGCLVSPIPMPLVSLKLTLELFSALV